MVSDDVVYLTIFLREGNTEVPLQQIAQVDSVLSHYRLIQTILCFEIGSNRIGSSAVI